MGGGDDVCSWALLSQSSSSSSSQQQQQQQKQPHSQTSSTSTQSSSSLSQASSKSVDLAELNHLRLLVAYEFDDAPATTDELIEALGACHNNTREAYHYLRSKRRLQAANGTTARTTSSSSSSTNDTMATAPLAPNKRRQDDGSDGDVVFVVENPSKRMREGTPPSSQQQPSDPPAPRSLRLHSSQDAEMASPMSSQETTSGATAPPNTQQQQHSEPEARVVCSQRKLSHDRDLALPSSSTDQRGDATMAPSQESESGAPPPAAAAVVQSPLAAADATRARQLLSDAIREQRTNPNARDDASWMSRVWDALMVSINLDVAQQLDQTCGALATWLDDVDTQDFVATQQRLALDLVLEIIAVLPRSDDTGELIQRVRPEQQNHELESEAAVAALQHALQHPDAGLNAHARSVAAEDAIKRLTSACSACIDRMVWFANAREANVTHQREMRAHVERLQSRLATMVAHCGAEVRTAESAVGAAREAKDTRSQQLWAFVLARRAELIASGETRVSAKVQAVTDVFNSRDVEVAALLAACGESSQTIEQCVVSMETCRHELAFAECAASLFAKVRDRREWFLQNALESFESARAASDERAAAALLRIVPVLTIALQHYYEFHSIRQARANDEATEQRKALERHIEYYGDSAPINKEEIEKRIREFVGVISRSMQLMLQIAETQSRLWRSNKDVLPRTVRHALVVEFSRLWQHLSGPVRDAMQSFVAHMQVGASAATPAPGTATSESVSLAASPVRAPLPPAAPLSSTLSLPPGATERSDDSPAPQQQQQCARSQRTSLSPSTSTVRTVTGSVVKTIVSSVQASPVRVENLSMTQEIDSFLLRHAEPVSALFTRVSGDDTAPRVPSASQRASAVAPAVVPSAYPAPASAGAPATPPDAHEYAVGTVLYTKFNVGKDVAQFMRGRVDKLLEDGTYSVVYDDGDVYTVPRAFLFTHEHMEQDLKLQERKRTASGASRVVEGTSSSSAQDASDGTCAIM